LDAARSAATALQGQNPGGVQYNNNPSSPVSKGSPSVQPPLGDAGEGPPTAPGFAGLEATQNPRTGQRQGAFPQGYERYPKEYEAYKRAFGEYPENIQAYRNEFEEFPENYGSARDSEEGGGDDDRGDDDELLDPRDFERDDIFADGGEEEDQRGVFTGQGSRRRGSWLDDYPDFFADIDDEEDDSDDEEEEEERGEDEDDMSQKQSGKSGPRRSEDLAQLPEYPPRRGRRKPRGY
jgi:hypothetical protein